MHLASLADWLTWAGLVVTVAALAWSGFSYIGLKREELSREQFERFFLTLERVHNTAGSLIAQKGAIYELRNYPAYRDVILRICDDAPGMFSPNYDPRIQIEFQLTADYIRKRR